MLNTMRILIVEDEFIALEYLKEILHSLGIKDIFDANEAKKALQIVNDETIDLVFMDININGAIDGIQCAKILNDEYNIPIIYTTAYGDTHTINEAKSTNVFGYLIKPFEQKDVKATLSIATSLIDKYKITAKDQTQSLPKQILLNDNQLYNFVHKTFSVEGVTVNLTHKELEIINLFCKNPDQNISYELLKQEVWNDKEIAHSTLRDTISRLKKKLPLLKLENVVNVGYILRTNLL